MILSFLAFQRLGPLLPGPCPRPLAPGLAPRAGPLLPVNVLLSDRGPELGLRPSLLIPRAGPLLPVNVLLFGRGPELGLRPSLLIPRAGPLLPVYVLLFGLGPELGLRPSKLVPLSGPLLLDPWLGLLLFSDLHVPAPVAGFVDAP